MAMKYMAAVWEFPGLTSTERLVALCIADNVNSSGTCTWITTKFISSHCVITERTVFRTLNTLEEKNVLARAPREGTNGGRKVTKLTFSSHVLTTVANLSLTYDQGPPDPMSGGDPDIMSVIPDPMSGGGDIRSVSPTPPNNDLPRTGIITTGGEPAAAGQNKLHPDFKKVFQFGCDKFPILQVRPPHSIHQWLANGADPEMDIFPVILDKHARGTEVKGWGIFTEGVTKSYKIRTSPLPEVRLNGSSSQKTFGQMKDDRSNAALARVAEKYGIKPEEIRKG